MSPSPPQVAVGAVVAVEDRLLLVQRAEPPAAGRWSVPGGKVEAGELLAAAVEREVAEETGIAVRCGSFIGWVERIAEGQHFVILDFEAHVVPGGDAAPVAGDDASAARWVPTAELAALDLVDGLAQFLECHGVTVRTRS